MSQLNDSKKRYDEIPIPEELSARVQEAIEQSEKSGRMSAGQPR